MSKNPLNLGKHAAHYGQIEMIDGAYLLKGTATTYMVLYGAGTALDRGQVTVLDAISGYAVIDRALVGVRGAGKLKPAAPVAAISHEVKVSAKGPILSTLYEDVIDGITRRREHAYWVEGNCVHVLISQQGAGSTEYESNYSGVYGGRFDDELAADLVEMTGTLTVPTVSAMIKESGEPEKPRFFSHMMDLGWSHASAFDLPNPAVVEDPHAWTYSTAGKYKKNTAGALQGPLQEMLLGSASYDIVDCLVHPAQSAPRIPKRSLQPWTLLTSRGESWDHFEKYLEWRAEMGMTSGVIYPMFWWQEINYPPSVVQANGQHWYPAGDHEGFASFCAMARALGFDVGGYTLWGIQKETVPNYNPGDRVLESSGAPRPSVWESNVWLSREEQTQKYMDLYLPKLRDEYHWSMIFYDVETYADPTHGNGDHVDMTAGSLCGTLAGCIAARREWMQYGQDVLGPDAFAHGEGSRGGYLNDQEYLWAGVMTGLNKSINTNSGKEEIQTTDPDRTMLSWPMALEYVWAVENQVFAHTPNFPGRTFSPNDASLQDPGVGGLFPFSVKMVDALRAVNLMHGRMGALPINGQGHEAFLSKREQVKEYYIASAISAFTRDLSVPTIHYHSDEHGYETFSQRYARTGLDGFRRTRVRLVFESGLEVYVSLDKQPWVLPDRFGVTIEEFGYFCFGSVNNTLVVGGSCSAPVTGNKRVDFVMIPGVLTAVDGRGEVTNFLGMPVPGGRLVVRDYKRQFVINEGTDGVLHKSLTTSHGF